MVWRKLDAKRRREKRQRRRRRLIQIFGGKCQECGTDEAQLEFAHVQETDVSGRGRGQEMRLRDIEQHPHCYRLLCITCHAEFDAQESHE